uniref:DNA polymerase subunit beta n=1 Tax=Thermofilum pendens TaxID=2269 RepID=A0A7C4D207_THEPE
MVSKFHPVRAREWVPVHYSEERWRTLEQLRCEAEKILSALAEKNIKAFAIGSLARGDVTPKSDVDIHVSGYVPSFIVAASLAEHGLRVDHYEVVQATPETAVKIIAVIDERTSITIPASRLSKTEEEFGRFAGAVDLDGLRRGLRVPGVNKRLLLIVPTEYGHAERSVLGFERETANLLGISLETVQERVRVRTRRAVRARSGFFLHKVLPPDSSPEKTLLDLASKLPALRLKLTGVLT